MNAATPRGFAVSDASTRERKARKIAALIGREPGENDLLDLGAGSGLLSAHFALAGWNVTAADRDTTMFQPSDIPVVAIGDGLPFADASFDVVVFNHVVEHVGDRAAQRKIIAEIARVLRPRGRLYFAVPNRFAPIEPHYRLPLLGALPRRIADAAVRRFGDNDRYDCWPLSYAEAQALLSLRFEITDRGADAFAFVVAHEIDGWAAALLRRIPTALVKAGRRLMPTLIFTGRKRASG